MIVDRNDIQKTLSASTKVLAYPFGCSLKKGFGADFIGLLKTLMICLNNGIDFRLCKVSEPRGFVARDGWVDYFEPIFKEVSGPFLQQFNIPQFPFNKRFPIVRPIVSLLLRLTTSPKVDYFEFDKIGNCDQLNPNVFGGFENYLVARSEVMKIIWQMNPETRAAVENIKHEAPKYSDYASLTIRRGDKNTESRFISMDQYISAIDQFVPEKTPIFLASDDSRTIEELTRRMPQRDYFFISDPSSRGYVHKDFLRLEPSERRAKMLRYFAEVELLWGAQRHIGSRTLNGSWMVNAFRGGDGVYWLD